MRGLEFERGADLEQAAQPFGVERGDGRAAVALDGHQTFVLQGLQRHARGVTGAVELRDEDALDQPVARREGAVEDPRTQRGDDLGDGS